MQLDKQKVEQDLGKAREFYRRVGASYGTGSGEITPTSSSSCTAPVDIIWTFSRVPIRPSTTRTYVTTPLYVS